MCLLGSWLILSRSHETKLPRKKGKKKPFPIFLSIVRQSRPQFSTHLPRYHLRHTKAFRVRKVKASFYFMLVTNKTDFSLNVFNYHCILYIYCTTIGWSDYSNTNQEHGLLSLSLSLCPSFVCTLAPSELRRPWFHRSMLDLTSDTLLSL